MAKTLTVSVGTLRRRARTKQHPEVVRWVDDFRTTSGRFPDIATLRSGKRPLRGPWVDVFRTPGGEIDLRSGRFCGSSYIVVTKYAISPTGDRFRLLASGKRPPTAREVDVFRTSKWQCPETVRKSSGSRPPTGRPPDDLRTLRRRVVKYYTSTSCADSPSLTEHTRITSLPD